MIVDLDALDLDARPVEDEDYVRPRDRRPKKQRSRRARQPPRAPAGPQPVAARRPGRRRTRRPGHGRRRTGRDAGRASDTLMPLEVDVLTLFPPMVEGPLRREHPGPDPGARPRDRPRPRPAQWGLGRHRTVDDYTYGGGAGMVLRPEPVAAALAELRRPGLDRDPARSRPARSSARRSPTSWRARPHLVFLCPRYEGVDERIRGDGGPGALDRRLRAHRRGAGGARDHRRGPAAAPGRHRRGVHRRGVVRGRPARVPAVHAPGDVRGRVGAAGPRLGPPRAGAEVAPRASRCAGRSSGGRTCSRDARSRKEEASCSTSCAPRHPRRSTRTPALGGRRPA